MQGKKEEMPEVEKQKAAPTKDTTGTEFNPEPTQKKGLLQKVKDFFNPPKLSEAQMKSDAKLYEELLKPQNKDNILVKTAKQSDIIET